MQQAYDLWQAEQTGDYTKVRKLATGLTHRKLPAVTLAFFCKALITYCITASSK